MSPRTGRRPGTPVAREQILAAARRCFGEHGFAGATIRRIAADAGVDPALVLHYFGTKADLFAASIDMPISPTEEIAALARSDPDRLGEAILRTLSTLWEQPEARAAWLGLIRSAASDRRAARMLREFLAATVVRPLAGALDVPDADRRIALVASQIVGLGMTRYVIELPPLAEAPIDEVVATLAPVLQHILTGRADPGPPA
jgi:AcrR family transcriptional regulator